MSPWLGLSFVLKVVVNCVHSGSSSSLFSDLMSQTAFAWVDLNQNPSGVSAGAHNELIHPILLFFADAVMFNITSSQSSPKVCPPPQSHSWMSQ